MKQNSSLDLLRRLEAATVVCHDCGGLYGLHTPTKYPLIDGCCQETSWEGWCQVCRTTSFVTDAREYGYLYKGRTLLKYLLKGIHNS